MRITDMRMETYCWPKTKPIRNGMYVYANAGLNVVRIETDEGVTGVGLAGGIEEAPEVGKVTAEHLKQYVVGQDPLRYGKVWGRDVAAQAHWTQRDYHTGNQRH